MDARDGLGTGRQAGDLVRLFPWGVLLMALLGACSSRGDSTPAASSASAVPTAPAIGAVSAPAATPPPPTPTAAVIVSPAPTTPGRIVAPPPGGIFDVKPGDYDGAATSAADGSYLLSDWSSPQH